MPLHLSQRSNDGSGICWPASDGGPYRNSVGRRSKTQARRVIMIMPAMLITSLGLVVTVADTVPRYNVRSTCRKAVALTAMGEGGRTIDSCVAGEETARKDVEKDWTKIPAAERTQC